MNKIFRSIPLVLLCFLSVQPIFSQALENLENSVCPLVGPFSLKTIPSNKTLDQILKDFRPDFIEWSILRRLPNHPPIIQGGWEYEGAPNKYKNFEKLWKKIFKSPWKPGEENGVAINVYSNSVKTPYSFYYWRMCHNNPRWHKFQKQTVLQRTKDQNIAIIRQDNIGVPVGITKNGGFCKFCQKKFHKFLLSKYSLDELRQMGINNPENFNIQNMF